MRLRPVSLPDAALPGAVRGDHDAARSVSLPRSVSTSHTCPSAHAVSRTAVAGWRTSAPALAAALQEQKVERLAPERPPPAGSASRLRHRRDDGRSPAKSPTRRTSGPACEPNASPIPERVEQGLHSSPTETRRRLFGAESDSSRRSRPTSRPRQQDRRRRSGRAAADDERVVGSCARRRRKQCVNGQAGARADASLAVRPQARQLGSAEPGAHAGDRVVPAHIVAADREQHPAAGERQRRAARFAGDKERRERRSPAKEPGELRHREMMEEEIGVVDDVGCRGARASEKVRRHRPLDANAAIQASAKRSAGRARQRCPAGRRERARHPASPAMRATPSMNVPSPPPSSTMRLRPPPAQCALSSSGP